VNRGLQRRNLLLASLGIEALPLILTALAPTPQPFLSGIGIRLEGTQAFGFHVETGLVTTEEGAVGSVAFLSSHNAKLL